MKLQNIKLLSVDSVWILACYIRFQTGDVKPSYYYFNAMENATLEFEVH